LNINTRSKKENTAMTFDEMKKIVVDTLNCDEDKVTMEASLTEDLEADSLDAVELNMALEDACGVSIPDEELAKLKTVGDIFNYITAHV
jgi:acyl carrier protein